MTNSCRTFTWIAAIGARGRGRVAEAVDVVVVVDVRVVEVVGRGVPVEYVEEGPHLADEMAVGKLVSVNLTHVVHVGDSHLSKDKSSNYLSGVNLRPFSPESQLRLAVLLTT